MWPLFFRPAPVGHQLPEVERVDSAYLELTFSMHTGFMDHTALTQRTSAAAFFSLTDTGRNGWWRYTLGVMLLIAVWMWGGDLVSPLLQRLPLGSAREFVATNADFVVMLLGVVMVHVRVHRRPWRALITTRPSIAWRRMIQGAAVWAVLMLVIVGVESALNPGRYVWTFEWRPWLLFFVLALLLTPIQCAAEELLFRGYLLQALGRMSRMPMVPAVLSSLLFTAPHLANPEVTTNGMLIMVAAYFTMGLFFALVALRDAGLELSIGAHTANNFFLIVFFGYKDSPLPASAMFTTAAYDPVFSLVSLLVGASVFYAWFFGRAQRPANRRQPGG